MSTGKNGVEVAAKVKGLRTQLQKMTGEADAMLADISARQKERSQKVLAIARLKAEIDACESLKELIVSEHAIVRFMERVMGLDTDAVRDQILCTKVRDLVDKLGGTGTYPADGFQVVMKNGAVVTVKT